jgi:hypothetical protein
MHLYLPMFAVSIGEHHTGWYVGRGIAPRTIEFSMGWVYVRFSATLWMERIDTDLFPDD